MSAARAQGIDLVAGGRNKSKHRSAPKSENVYQLLLVKVRARWTGCALGPGRGRWRQFSLVLGGSDDERRSCPHLVKGNVSVWKTQEHA